MTLFEIFSGGPSDVLANVGNRVLLVTLISAQDFRHENKHKYEQTADENCEPISEKTKPVSGVADRLNLLE